MPFEITEEAIVSRETEKMFRQLNAYLAQNDSEDMDDEKMEQLVNEFMQKYNDSVPVGLTEKTAKTADDFMELAEEADNEGSALKYAKKAFKLDPDNLDAERMIAAITASDQIDQMNKLERAVEHGEKVMKAKGYADDSCIGEYWGITATRPFMRLRMDYMNILKENGMFRKAISECEDMIRLSENDNLGVRYTLMHLYVLMEEEEKALALHQHYDAYEETQMLLPLSVLYFKLGNLEKSADYLKRLSAANKDLKKFLRAIENGDLERYADEMSDMGYRPFSIEELLVDLMENSELFGMVPGYFYWANKQLKGKKG